MTWVAEPMMHTPRLVPEDGPASSDHSVTSYYVMICHYVTVCLTLCPYCLASLLLITFPFLSPQSTHLSVRAVIRAPFTGWLIASVLALESSLNRNLRSRHFKLLRLWTISVMLKSMPFCHSPSMISSSRWDKFLGNDLDIVLVILDNDNDIFPH